LVDPELTAPLALKVAVVTKPPQAVIDCRYDNIMPERLCDFLRMDRAVVVNALQRFPEHKWHRMMTIADALVAENHGSYEAL
jgi:hypothetical protein